MTSINFINSLICLLIDGSVNTNDYNIPQVHPKPVEPTYSVLEVPKPHLVAPPSLDEVKEEPETEPQKQLSEQDDITVAKEDQLASLDKSKQCLNNQFGIGIVECDENTQSSGTGMGYRTTIEFKPIPKSQCADPQIDNANENSMDVQRKWKMPPSSSHSVPAIVVSLRRLLLLPLTVLLLRWKFTEIRLTCSPLSNSLTLDLCHNNDVLRAEICSLTSCLE